MEPAVWAVGSRIGVRKGCCVTQKMVGVCRTGIQGLYSDGEGQSWPSQNLVRRQPFVDEYSNWEGLGNEVG